MDVCLILRPDDGEKTMPAFCVQAMTDDVCSDSNPRHQTALEHVSVGLPVALTIVLVTVQQAPGQDGPADPSRR